MERAGIYQLTTGAIAGAARDLGNAKKSAVDVGKTLAAVRRQLPPEVGRLAARVARDALVLPDDALAELLRVDLSRVVDKYIARPRRTSARCATTPNARRRSCSSTRPTRSSPSAPR